MTGTLDVAGKSKSNFGSRSTLSEIEEQPTPGYSSAEEWRAGEV